MAALDRRLQAHQEAYGLLMEALASVHQPDVLHKTVIERDQCWKTSCLYLSAEARAALQYGYMAAAHHPNLMRGTVSGQE